MKSSQIDCPNRASCFSRIFRCNGRCGDGWSHGRLVLILVDIARQHPSSILSRRALQDGSGRGTLKGAHVAPRNRTSRGGRAVRNRVARIPLRISGADLVHLCGLLVTAARSFLWICDCSRGVSIDTGITRGQSAVAVDVERLRRDAADWIGNGVHRAGRLYSNTAFRVKLMLLIWRVSMS